MQTAKNAAASVKETAANVAASAKSGMDKTKATVQEKVEKMTAHDPAQKERASHLKEEKVNRAEYNKLGAREQNAASKQAAAIGAPQKYTAVGTTTGGPTAHIAEAGGQNTKYGVGNPPATGLGAGGGHT